MESEKIKQLIKSYEETYIFATRQLHDAIAEQILGKEGISFEQFLVLRYLAENGESSPNHLATVLHVHKSAITTKINRLLEKNLIHKEKNQQDQRSFVLNVTENGEKVYQACEQKLEELVSSWVEILGEEDSEQFLALYKKITASVIRK
ncbi:putative MarR family transcriptional regulator [Listeria weihenstephanensis FSL R9-0317]|uniref:HTH-type transcriptional regulator SarZ n=1 Tax=Listeria weihenstephanensis TaxID=1006155 RepID=A0A1S7FUD0_9LIST|nr:MarR family transcriptional regulator [Listeria weihenstephanensis]AQY50945.1 MarR family transcriptional regulator [Listeria weihenstephanensis]EUJ36351.1 putative MarR family transcriptional regulator [Listeria weihenstephanensis FSL R9-0317]MBC1499885.1 MarR family transcriptional regulator [Listeria weihenstephanensis]